MAGPAVVGVVRSRIVLPEWARGAEPDVRALMLAHEEEHVHAGDPRLLALGLAVAALMPWSPAAWWMLRRLRLAVEMDCDARVLRRRADVRAYGTLLLEMGRRAGGSRLAVAALSEPASFLERRIRTMTAPKVRFPAVRAAAFGAAAAALVLAACETPGPVQVAPASADRVYVSPDGAQGAVKRRLDPRAMVERYYPEVLARGAGPGATLTFVLSTAGEVVHHSLDREAVGVGEVTVNGGSPRFRISPTLTEKNLNPRDIASVDVLRFNAGQMGPDPVGVVWIQMGEPGQAAAGGPGAEIRISTRDADAAPAADRVGDGARRQNGGRLQQLVEKYRPRDVPEGVSQLVWARFTLDADGKAQGLSIEPGAHPAAAEAARKVLAEMVFVPAEQGHQMRLGIDFALGRGLRTAETTASTGRVPSTPRGTIEAALRQRFPNATPDAQYWFVADDRNQVLQSGSSLQDGAIRAIDPETIAMMQVERVQIDGREAKVMWIRLKGDTSL